MAKAGSGGDGKSGCGAFRADTKRSYASRQPALRHAGLAVRRSQGGQFLLRVEDLDKARAPQKYANQLEADLRFLGFDWDAGGSWGGPHAPYYQSERTAFYQELLDKLQRRGLIYPCFCTRAQLHAATAPHASDGEPVYDGRCRRLSAEAVAEQMKSRTPALRLRVPDETISFSDGHYGLCRQHLAGSSAGDTLLDGRRRIRLPAGCGGGRRRYGSYPGSTGAGLTAFHTAAAVSVSIAGRAAALVFPPSAFVDFRRQAAIQKRSGFGFGRVADKGLWRGGYRGTVGLYSGIAVAAPGHEPAGGAAAVFLG